MKIQFLLLSLMTIGICSGCLSLKEIKEYSSTSINSLQKIDHLQYSFNEYCNRDCNLQQMRKGVIDTQYNCNCIQIASKADSAIWQINSTIIAYLRAIEQLSNNQQFIYDASGLSGALQSNPLLKLNDQQTAIISKSGNFLATIATSFYRKSEFKKYIEQADPVFGDLMDTFIYLLNNRLRTQLRIDYEKHETNLKQQLDNSVNDNSLKQMIVLQFINERKYYLHHVSLLDCYVSLISKVKDGHHQIYLQREHLQDKSLKNLAKRYADDIQSLAASVKQ